MWHFCLVRFVFRMGHSMKEIANFRLLLIQEKEQLLRELRSIKPKGRSEKEMSDINTRISQLEHDLVAAMELSSKQIAERLKLNEEKSRILSQLAEATRLTTYLESQLRRFVCKLLGTTVLSERSHRPTVRSGWKQTSRAFPQKLKY